MKFLVKVVLLAVVFYFVAKYVHGVKVLDANPDAVLGLSITFVWLGLLFAVINAVLRPVFKLFSLPFVILTLGLFYLVINAALLGITAAVSSKLEVDGFVAAVEAGFFLALASWVADLVLNRD